MSEQMNYPPPPPRSGNGSCWKWGGIACVGCGCVGVLAIAALLAFTFSRPEVREQFSRVMSTAQEASVTVQRMQAVGEAIGKFVEDNGRYPERLVDITPRYIEAGMLKATDRPDAKPIVYHKPPDNAPPTFRVLEVEIPNPVMPTQAPPIRYYWTKAGKLETPSAFQVEAEASKKRSSGTPAKDSSGAE